MSTGTGIPVSPFVVVKAAGEMASAIAWRLYRANIRRTCLLELDQPLCVRRRVSFCTALESGSAVVEGVQAVAAHNWNEVDAAWNSGSIAVVRILDWARMEARTPDVVVDAILAKRNLGTRIGEGGLVVALGPGFEAGQDCHFVIETNRGHDLGRIIAAGPAAPNTGVPGEIAGQTDARVLRAPADGPFRSERSIGDLVRAGDIVGHVGGKPVKAGLDGILRGLIRTGTDVTQGVKLGDIDPRARREYCDTISDKARAIAGSVLECVLRHCNRPGLPRTSAPC
jgi:xanthine dehydrogenase accessory factor